jgi:hypothetical protein
MFISHHTSEEGHSKDLLLLENICRKNIKSNKDLIYSMDTTIKSKINLGDYSKVKYLRKGIVFVLTKQDQQKDIHDVYYIPNRKHNMISVE